MGVTLSWMVFLPSWLMQLGWIPTQSCHNHCLFSLSASRKSIIKQCVNFNLLTKTFICITARTAYRHILLDTQLQPIMQPRFLLWSKFKSCVLQSIYPFATCLKIIIMKWTLILNSPLIMWPPLYIYHWRYHFTEPNNTGYVSQHMRTGCVFTPCRKCLHGISWTGIYKVHAIHCDSTVPVER